jgi:hypothetical protein
MGHVAELKPRRHFRIPKFFDYDWRLLFADLLFQRKLDGTR